MTPGRPAAVGVDIASVARVAEVVRRNPRFARRVYTEAERRDCERRPRRWASRWAAKEAVRKLAGGAGRPLPAFRDVEVAVGAGGAPTVTVCGRDAGVSLSLGYEGDTAVAIAAIAGTPPRVPLLPVPPGLRLPDRPGDAHKGTFGTVLVVGGAVGLTGAPYLAAMGAARGGAGRVRLCVPEPVYAVVAARCVEVMPHPLAAAGGGLGGEALAQLLEQHLPGAGSAVLGPGLTTAQPGAGVLLELLTRLRCPAVVDADGLSIAAAAAFDWRSCAGPVVVTPHPAEMGRLAGISVAAVQADRAGVAAAYARDRGVTVVLKGSGTVVADPEGRLHQAASGLVALATGGTGDVLAGLIGAMLAQGMEARAAAVAGVTIHAEAGAAIQNQRGRAGALAGDLLQALPQAQERLRWALEEGDSRC